MYKKSSLYSYDIAKTMITQINQAQNKQNDKQEETYICSCISGTYGTMTNCEVQILVKTLNPKCTPNLTRSGLKASGVCVCRDT